jgi:hypothetical protein
MRGAKTQTFFISFAEAGTPGWRARAFSGGPASVMTESGVTLPDELFPIRILVWAGRVQPVTHLLVVAKHPQKGESFPAFFRTVPQSI